MAHLVDESDLPASLPNSKSLHISNLRSVITVVFTPWQMPEIMCYSPKELVYQCTTGAVY